MFSVLFALIISALRGRCSRGRCSLATFMMTLNSPTSWTLHIWMLLVLYPTLCTKSFEIFSCVELFDQSFLRADPGLMCETAEWWGWLTVSVVSIAIYCLGIPSVMFFCVSRYASLRNRQLTSSSAYWWRSRIPLLLSSYTYDAWWFESFDLIRKLLLASVVRLAWPDTALQLAFGTITALASLLIILVKNPYHKPRWQRLQTTIQLQLIMTYIAATALFQDPRLPLPLHLDADEATDTEGLLLVSINCIGFAGLALFTCLSLHFVATHTGRLKDTHGLVIIAPPPRAQAGFHLFLSHTWSFGQDQMRIVKERVNALIPGLRVFLDVDDLKEGKGGEYVDCSDHVLVFVTSSYFTSVNCMRELLRALFACKPIITLIESEARHGAVSEESVRQELNEADIKYLGQWGDANLGDEVKRWLREAGNKVGPCQGERRPDKVASGLAWMNVGKKKPTGTELVEADSEHKLIVALRKKTDFTKLEYRTFRLTHVRNLCMKHYVKVDRHYYQPEDPDCSCSVCKTWRAQKMFQRLAHGVPVADDIFAALFEKRAALIEWNRLPAFQDMTIYLLGKQLLPTDCEVQEHALPKASLSKPPHPRHFHVYCSPNNPRALNLLTEVSANGNVLLKCEATERSGDQEELTSGEASTIISKRKLSTSAFAFGSSTPLQVAHGVDYLSQCQHMLVYLTDETWTSPTAAAFAEEVQRAIDLDIHLLLAHEMPGLNDGPRHACEFSSFFTTTPQTLIDNKLYNQIAIPLKGDEWRKPSLSMMMEAICKSEAEEGVSNPSQAAAMRVRATERLKLLTWRSTSTTRKTDTDRPTDLNEEQQEEEDATRDGVVSGGPLVDAAMPEDLPARPGLPTSRSHKIDLDGQEKSMPERSMRSSTLGQGALRTPVGRIRPRTSPAEREASEEISSDVAVEFAIEVGDADLTAASPAASLLQALAHAFWCVAEGKDVFEAIDAAWMAADQRGDEAEAQRLMAMLDAYGEGRVDGIYAAASLRSKSQLPQPSVLPPPQTASLRSNSQLPESSPLSLPSPQLASSPRDTTLPARAPVRKLDRTVGREDSFTSASSWDA